MLEIERSFIDFALYFAGAVHIHGLDPDRGQDPDLARRKGPRLAAPDLVPVQHLRKRKLLQPNHLQDLVPDRKAEISSFFQALLASKRIFWRQNIFFYIARCYSLHHLYVLNALQFSQNNNRLEFVPGIA